MLVHRQEANRASNAMFVTNNRPKTAEPYLP
jgi:hypothetical protein